jgi:hypothetical protein
MRHYCYHVCENVTKRNKRWNLYVTAHRGFSLKEILAKQHWVLRHIDELPFNNIMLLPPIILLWIVGWALFWTGSKRKVANTCSGATARLLAMEAEE